MGAEEQIIAQNKRDRMAIDEIRADRERLGQALRAWLLGVSDGKAEL